DGTLSNAAFAVSTLTRTTAHNEFVAGSDYADSLTVATADGTTQLITVTLHGSDDATVITGTATAELTESNVAQSTGGTLSASDEDSRTPVTTPADASGTS